MTRLRASSVLPERAKQRLFQRLAHGRTLDRDERGVDAAGERPGHAVVRRDGQLHLGLPGEDHQPHTVLPQSVEEFADGILGPFQPVGLEVFGQHRIGDVDGQHHFDALRLLFAELGLELWGRAAASASKAKAVQKRMNFKAMRPDETSGISSRSVASHPKRARRRR